MSEQCQSSSQHRRIAETCDRHDPTGSYPKIISGEQHFLDPSTGALWRSMDARPWAMVAWFPDLKGTTPERRVDADADKEERLRDIAKIAKRRRQTDTAYDYGFGYRFDPDTGELRHRGDVGEPWLSVAVFPDMVEPPAVVDSGKTIDHVHPHTGPQRVADADASHCPPLDGEIRPIDGRMPTTIMVPGMTGPIEVSTMAYLVGLRVAKRIEEGDTRIKVRGLNGGMAGVTQHTVTGTRKTEG